MPLSYLLRPSAFLAAAALALCAALSARGAFKVTAPASVSYYCGRGPVDVGARLLTGFNPKRMGDRYWAVLEAVDGRAVPPSRAAVYLKDREAARALRPGMRVGFHGALRSARGMMLPGGFDEREFLQLNGASVALHAASVAALSPEIPWSAKPWAWGEGVHRSVNGYLRRRFANEEASVLEGLLLGFQGTMPPEAKRAVQTAGAMHMLTPSGDKVTMVFAWAHLAAMLLGFRPPARLRLSCAAATAFLLVVGLDPSYTRAWGMTMFCAAAWRAGRLSAAFQGLLLAMTATLALDPRSVDSAGFHLTYLALFGILMALPRWRAPRSWPGAARVLFSIFAVSAAVQLMVWPVFARYFASGSLGGFFVNMVLIPASGLINAASAAAWALHGLGWSWLEPAAAAAAASGARFFLGLCRFAASVPGCAVALSPPSAAETLAYYLAAFGALVIPRWRPSGLFFAGALLVWGLSAAAERIKKPGVLLDVFGESRLGAVLRLPSGEAVVIDAGLPPSAWKTALPVLDARSPLAVWRGPGSFSYGDFRLVWSREGLRASTGGNGHFCIMNSSSGQLRRLCAEDYTLSPSRQGPVRIVSDGRHLELITQENR